MISNFQDLLTSVDVLNTINGGVSEPIISHRERTSGREMRVRVPGIERDALRVEIHNNQLSIFYFVPVESMGKLIEMPQVIYKKAIPYFIEVTGIKATYENRELVVTLPFNRLSKGYDRKLTIE